MDVNIGYIQKMTSPAPFALLSSLKENGETNLMAVSWWTYASNNPPLIAVCLSNKGASGSLIKAAGEFGLCTVDTSLGAAAFKCGTSHGDTVNKAFAYQIELTEACVIRPKLVRAHKTALECRLISTAAASDHTIYIAEVVAAHVNENATALYAFDGYTRLDTIP